MALIHTLCLQEKRVVPELSHSRGQGKNDLVISASSLNSQLCDHLVLPYIIACNGVFYRTHAMNNIGASGQAFIDILFAQLHGFKFIRLQ